MELLQNKLNWTYYGGKHYESVYTRFYQAYYLPQKFNIDKRKCHLSDLINAKQLTRNEALSQLEHKDYKDEMFRDDLEFVLKKLEFTQEEFEAIMQLPVKSYKDYPNNHDLVMRIKRNLNKLRKMNILPR